MSTTLDVLGVAARSLRGRRGRTLLMAVGPLLAVTVVVGALGVLSSTTGQLRSDLARLGADLVVLEDDSTGTFLSTDAPERAEMVPTVEFAAASSVIPEVFISPIPPQPGEVPDPVGQAIAATPDLPGLFGIDLAWGRGLTDADDAAATTAAVVGSALAVQLGLQQDQPATIYVGPQPFGVVGVLEAAEIGGSLNNAVLIPAATAQQRFGLDRGWQQLQARVAPPDVEVTAPMVVDLVTRGDPGGVRARVPTDLLAAQAAVDTTLAGAVVGLGALVLLVGGFGIANVMLLSVLERRREIGTRRALGHPRSIIAGQFVAETTLIGIVGAVAGGVLGVVATIVAARVRGWVAVIDPTVVIVAVLAAIVMTTVAGLYPAWRAARLEPLAAIRAD